MRFLLIALLCLVAGPALAATSYHGFTLDESGLPGPAVAAGLAGAESQIDQMEADRLPPALMQFMRGLPIHLHDREGGEGAFRGNERAVNINKVAAGDPRPILLHEYLHAYEWFAMPGGFQNADVHHFYDEAKAGGLFPADAYMMKNAAEFFAVTASCYLHGTVARPPYDRAGIQRAQPDYYAWLQQLFGPVGQ